MLPTGVRTGVLQSARPITENADGLGTGLGSHPTHLVEGEKGSPGCLSLPPPSHEAVSQWLLSHCTQTHDGGTPLMQLSRACAVSCYHMPATDREVGLVRNILMEVCCCLMSGWDCGASAARRAFAEGGGCAALPGLVANPGK
eukprot:4850377-Amphidinium_carterae.1